MSEPTISSRPGLSRRRFVACSSVVIASASVSGIRAQESESPEETGKPRVRVGIVTDVHYADKVPAGTRHYRESQRKLAEAVALFEEQKVDWIIELGDIVDAAPTVDEELSYLRTIDKVLKSADVPVHYVLGNHCVATLTKEEFLKTVKAKKSYYSFDYGGLHFVVLDACYNHKMEPYGRANFTWTDTNIPPEQADWLEKDLKGTELQTIVFVHQRLDLEPSASYAVKQSPAIRGILERSGKVRAVFQGHSHKNELHRIEGISYCVNAAMVEGSGMDNSAYSILEVARDGKVTLTGFRKQQDREFAR